MGEVSYMRFHFNMQSKLITARYSYGCAEIVFHPMKSWLFKGPLTPLFRKFLGSKITLSSKFSILAYMMSCKFTDTPCSMSGKLIFFLSDFALASGGTLTLANYFLIGWFNGELDKFYMQSWNGKYKFIYTCFGSYLTDRIL
jgi:hypothetical protein